MSYYVKREHLIGDKRVPYELRCDPLAMHEEFCLVRYETPSGMIKDMSVRADQVYFKLEAV